MTSHDVVAVARRALGERRIGHAGTLDPFATGLLVLLVGRATRLLPYLDGEPKVYDATIRFGTATDTDDATGASISSAEIPARERIDAAIRQLTGDIAQLPPNYSAKQVDGRRAYDAARKGTALALEPVKVKVHEWAVRSWDAPDLRVTITCGGGTYIRALARDLGALADSAAHCAELRRTRSGAFDVANAVTIDAMREIAAADLPLMPSLTAISSLPVESLDADAIRRVASGMSVPARMDGARAALVDDTRQLVAVAERVADAWQPRVVMRDA